VTDIFIAVQRGDQGTVERLLHASPTQDLNALDSKGNALLHYATRRPHAGIALLLLSRGANPNVKSTNELREPPLHGAIVMDELQLVQQMIALHNADIHATNAKGYNALHTAVQFKRFLLTAYLLRCGAHVDAADNDAHTALHWAAYVGHARLTRMLINHNADPTRVDDRGMTPLHWAAAKGFLEVVDELTTPTRGNEAHVELDVYTQMKTRDQQGLLAVEHAQKNKHKQVADYIAVLRRVIFNDGPMVSTSIACFSSLTALLNDRLLGTEVSASDGILLGWSVHHVLLLHVCFASMY
jgi:ankyrin repeat protein